MRTALSRMVANGEVELADGRYTLGVRLRERQSAQDAARRSAPGAWDGSWWIAVVDAKGVEDARRDTEFVTTGAVEDLAMAAAVQQGLAAGANDVVELGLFEGALSHFHRSLDALLVEESA